MVEKMDDPESLAIDCGTNALLTLLEPVIRSGELDAESAKREHAMDDDSASGGQASVGEASGIEASGGEASLGEASGIEASGIEASGGQASLGEASGIEASVGEASGIKASGVEVSSSRKCKSKLVKNNDFKHIYFNTEDENNSGTKTKPSNSNPMVIKRIINQPDLDDPHAFNWILGASDNVAQSIYNKFKSEYDQPCPSEQNITKPLNIVKVSYYEPYVTENGDTDFKVVTKYIQTKPDYDGSDEEDSQPEN